MAAGKAQADGPRTVRLVLTVVGPPPPDWAGWRDIEAGIQRRSGEVVPAVPRPDGSVSVGCELRAAASPDGGGPLVLAGPCALGPPTRRFLYVSWSGAAEGERRMFRRAKVPLSSIREELVDAASGIPGGYLASEIDGTARDGGPACGSVPLRGGGWVLADGDAVG